MVYIWYEKLNFGRKIELWTWSSSTNSIHQVPLEVRVATWTETNKWTILRRNLFKQKHPIMKHFPEGLNEFQIFQCTLILSLESWQWITGSKRANCSLYSLSTSKKRFTAIGQDMNKDIPDSCEILLTKYCTN